MVTRVVRTEDDADKLAALIKARGQYPLTVTFVKGEARRNRQNRLAFIWYTEIAMQLGDQTAHEARAECKVIYGAPILCEEVPAFAVSWAKLRQRMTHEEILEFVRETELPITRLMTVAQMSRYMDAVQRHYAPMGVRLTHPDDLKYQEEFE